MQARWRLLMVACVLASLFVSALGSASPGSYAETRVRGLDLGNPASIRAERPVTLGTHQGYALGYDDFASGYLLAARGARKLTPDPRAVGPHSVFRTDQAGKVTKYETFQPQTNPHNPNPWESVGRFDGSGPGHFNKATGQDVPTPHVHDPGAPGGVRPPDPSELPLGYE